VRERPPERHAANSGGDHMASSNAKC
jgi:hypothetical protein